ncbi:MAG TPA: efflux RND transporter periplasmic adaptor subunit [Nitrosomonas sp.]|nr:efflux RND transporter periplasmic adaptor subunit [Nitrosomonas sp.]HQX13307.1 efflux RND transporter periplasmic adaptor subunit [Nitrosomonas sp.]HRB31782.1 efflux RND transporter periplasmic adaptor subunit [Nitrosomonas sp.]HRB44378.1 efflux RND transporter periplasmic adaptor subunit [Nitrosomonas sp.]HRB78022.1 efflux RND transporter periplasmic adaptor subunit [Nitrosomonas sp.]
MINQAKLKPIIIVIGVGIILAGLILLLDKPTGSSEETENGAAVEDSNTDQKDTGPRGGKFFQEGDFALEVTIFEKGVAPEFRIYLYEKGKPIPPTSASVAVTLSRLGAPAQLIKFKPEADYLLGDQVVKEPHSFEVAIAAEHNKKVMRWSYSQVEGRIEMQDEMLKSVGVDLLSAGPAVIRSKLKLPGEIVFNEHNIVRVVPRVAGLVTEVRGHHGQHVKQGDVLAIIESPTLSDLRSQYFVANKRLKLARTTYEREKKLWEEKISAKQDFLTAEELWQEAQIAVEQATSKLRALGVKPEASHSAADFPNFIIRAPITGIIIAKAIARGESLKEDREIYTIADVSTIWTAVTVYPKDLNAVRVGQKAKVRAAASNVESEGTVTYISTLIGGQTRTATARVELDNADNKWRPGMFVNVELIAEEITVPVAVSMNAIQTFRDWSVVFGRYDQFFEVRPLELGRSDGDNVEVLSGLTAGEVYASGNSFALKAELGKAGASHDH